MVATVLTVYDIETNNILILEFLYAFGCNSTYRLRYWNFLIRSFCSYLFLRCNSTYRLRYWNILKWHRNAPSKKSCNSTYRLRYWNYYPIPRTNPPDCSLQQYLPFTVLKPNNEYSTWVVPLKVATVLTVYGIETLL